MALRNAKTLASQNACMVERERVNVEITGTIASATSHRLSLRLRSCSYDYTHGQAGVIYVKTLGVLTTTGRLEDPYEELCVKESKFINKGILEVDYTDEYWDRRYTVNFASEKMMFLSHVLLEVDFPVALVYRPSWSVGNTSFYLHCKFIENTYTHGSYLLLQDEQLIYRLRSLKHYFFLASSSFLTYLLDLAHGTEKGPAKGVSIVKPQSLFDLALTGEDAVFREDVSSTRELGELEVMI
ncbi:uncharacterized protein HD556DRAFT_1312532 [Suillus plorans]|uniref:Uncharacterized protein n=1 Tax=Suillus plorans TaxID=116603 RepID=A0A9P7AEH2_9AGAM|nr:uncharacterized protein HD556DRAFT_1312532 [Suillus plorans]KAG1787791.1 hypothetical protein HD556DRAFT_1312532 [Suillus plorans]